MLSYGYISLCLEDDDDFVVELLSEVFENDVHEGSHGYEQQEDQDQGRDRVVCILKSRVVDPVLD